MSDTIKTPDPGSPGGKPEASKGTITPPSSWVETQKPPSTDSPATIMSPASIEEFPEEVRPHALDPNRQVNQYILVKVLGKGGMGEVWKAWDRKLSRWAAIKFLLGESAEGVLRFRREAKMAARLSHPNIAPVHEVGEAPSRQPGQPLTHFLAMEYIDGSTLGSAKLSMRDRVDVFIKVAQGIDAAHKGGIVHRDIKPANIMLTKENWPYVMDFGLAKSLDGDNNLSATGAVMGTPAFMPPEQVEGRLEEIGPWSDVYSLGATMYAVFCGSHPFTAQTTLQLLQKVCNEAPLPPRQKNPEISPELEGIILRAMAKKREDRYASAGAASDALKKVLARIDAAAEGAPVSSPPPAPVPPPAPKTSRALPLVAVLLLILVGGAGAAVWWFKFRKAPGVTVAVAGTKPVETAISDPQPENRTRPKTDFALPVAKTEPNSLATPGVQPDPSAIARDPAAKAEPKPESKPEVKPDLKPEPKPEVKVDPKPDLKPGVKSEPKPEVKPIVPPALTAEQVVQRGFDWLAGLYRQAALSSDSDYWAAYALLFGRTEMARPRIAEFLRSAAWQQSAHGTPVAALRSLALSSSGDPRLQELTAECAQFLVEAQGPNGLWADAAEVEVRLEEPRPAEGSAFIISGDPARKRCELARKGTAKKAPDGDLGTTSLALLGLYAAENCGHRVPAETWKRALDAVEAQWGKDVDALTNASCIVSSLICRQSLGDPDAAQNARVLAAVRALPAGDAGQPLALLDAIERAGGMLSTPRLGDLEWYGSGAKALAASQQPDGSWVEDKDPVLGTARALLFLTRATAALKADAKRGGTGRLEMKSLGGCTNLMFVLDASGRMRQELDDRERFDVAKETIAKIVEKLPDGAIVGLRVFGNRKLATEEGTEIDTSLVTPPGPVNPRQIATHMQALRVKGRSPLTFTLIQTLQDLTQVPADVEMAVVLLVDGTDMERKADPVPATGDLAASRRGLKVHVVGFNTEDDDIQVRLQKMADAGGGQYIAAKKAKDLLPRLAAATIGEQDYAVLNEKGETVAKGRLGDSRALPEGRYTVVCGGQQEKIWINPGLATRIIIHQQKLAAPK
jgi:serine/threonine protein kinase